MQHDHASPLQTPCSAPQMEPHSSLLPGQPWLPQASPLPDCSLRSPRFPYPPRSPPSPCSAPHAPLAQIRGPAPPRPSVKRGLPWRQGPTCP